MIYVLAEMSEGMQVMLAMLAIMGTILAVVLGYILSRQATFDKRVDETNQSVGRIGGIVARMDEKLDKVAQTVDHNVKDQWKRLDYLTEQLTENAKTTCELKGVVEAALAVLREKEVR